MTNIEAVSKIFERDINTQLVVVRIHIWKDTEDDPYRGPAYGQSLFNIFVNVWSKSFKDVSYDKVCYLYTKPGVYGGLGSLGGAYSLSPLYGSGPITHEFGHNFNSPHSHNCNWPGGPIDYCSRIEGECYSASLETTFLDGTIMSYCGGVRQFHPLCRAVMTDHAEKTLPKLTKTPDKSPVLPIQFVLGRTTHLYWPGVPEAERYVIEVATDAAFTKKIVSSRTELF